MTLGIVLNCPEGVVVGSDRKVVQNKGVSIQSKRNKLQRFEIGNGIPIICCIAGGVTVARRALSQIDPRRWEEEAESMGFHQYMTDKVERILPQFAADYQEKHDRIPNYRLGMATITEDGNAAAATVYPTGEFDYEDHYTAVGSGSLLAEHFLRDQYCRSLSLDEARKYVGYVIQRVAEIDSNVEGVNVESIDSDGNEQPLSPEFKTALQAIDVFQFDFSMNIDNHMAQLNQVASTFEDEADELIEE